MHKTKQQATFWPDLGPGPAKKTPIFFTVLARFGPGGEKWAKNAPDGVHFGNCGQNGKKGHFWGPLFLALFLGTRKNGLDGVIFGRFLGF